MSEHNLVKGIKFHQVLFHCETLFPEVSILTK